MCELSSYVSCYYYHHHHRLCLEQAFLSALYLYYAVLSTTSRLKSNTFFFEPLKEKNFLTQND